MILYCNKNNLIEVKYVILKIHLELNVKLPVDSQHIMITYTHPKYSFVFQIVNLAWQINVGAALYGNICDLV